MAKNNDRIETMTEGQRAYEERRAAKAGVTLEKWIAQRDRVRAAEAPRQAAPEPTRSERRGWFSRLFRRKRKAQA